MAEESEAGGRLGTGRSVVFDRAAGYYDATRGFPPGVDEQVALLFVEAGNLEKQSRVFELGAGTGRIAVPLAERVGSVVGADLSRPMLARLLAKGGGRPLRPVQADVARLPFRSACFDAVVAVHVFHLIAGWREALAESARVLRPGGLLLHGSDDHARGIAFSSWREQVDQGLGLEDVGVPRSRIESFPEDEGWELAGTAHLRFQRLWRPGDLLAAVEKRQWSSCWRMTDAQVAQACRFLRTELQRRFGDLERQVQVESGFQVRAYRPPAEAR